MRSSETDRDVVSAAAPADPDRGDQPGPRWRALVIPYAKPDRRLAVGQLLNTLLPFLGLVAIMVWGHDRGSWAVLLLSPIAAVLLVRLFIIQHDCGHAAFFPSPRANDRLGRLLGVLTLTPYTFWRREHAVHHATSGNLDRRGTGDVTTLTVQEYRSRSALARLAYRLYRHPLVLFGIGPTFHFLIRHRVPTGSPRRHRQAWLSVLGTNAALAGIGLVMGLTIGLQPFLLAYLPAALIAASIGVWLFYVQHQFEHTYWQPTASWGFATAALEGSSFYDLPRPLHWATGYIGFHHLHHLCSRIPNYRLAECHAQNPELQRFAKRVTLRDSLRCARLALWDPEQGRLVSFRQARSRPATVQSRTRSSPDR